MIGGGGGGGGGNGEGGLLYDSGSEWTVSELYKYEDVNLVLVLF